MLYHFANKFSECPPAGLPTFHSNALTNEYVRKSIEFEIFRMIVRIPKENGNGNVNGNSQQDHARMGL